MWWRVSRAISAVLSACAALYASAALCVAATDEHPLTEALAIVQLLREGYSGVPWRRFDYEDVFGPHPPSSATSNRPSSLASNTHTKHSLKYTSTPLSRNPTTLLSSTTPLSSKPSSSASNTVSTTSLTSITYPFKSNSYSYINNTRRTSKTSPSKLSTAINLASSSKPQYSSSSKIPNHHSKSTITNQILTHTTAKPAIITKPLEKLSLKKKGTIDATEMTPELQQAAIELAGELNGSGGELTKRSRLHTARPAARVSWREHLPRSTRYAVPFPENHAFCYTHPRNALCRTFI